ncbi:MAG: RNA polymerase sigma factor RpoE [Burkholderiaceae bacterium]|nr:RNA polymerase sigma factor RpoE [Burkholderiaceae bacterium]MDP4740814.1 RNA polymerase sigma factor RpoE [Burkholderiaceae bacterium]MDP4829680.1 RNA polymerase sigma factor RpoE [Burkholderiaceae bacterium]MDP4948963.1 RNA polymerase sigma factor RpoE [Burkholderiaceae bacterium]MDP5127718.1 RNA polymerase sigma factor RpoE [Burkholderiaceae bacterium]
MAEIPSDLDLVQRVKNGDKEAFNLLVLKYQRKVGRLVRRLVSNSDEADDVVQDAFIKAYRALPQFRGDSAFYTWLYRIAVNTAKNHLVSRGKRPISLSELTSNEGDDESFEVPVVTIDNNTPEAELMSRQIAEAVNRAVSALPEELQTALSLREIDGLSYEEIAEAMNCPIGTVRSRIFRAREAVAAELKPLLNVSPDRRW